MGSCSLWLTRCEETDRGRIFLDNLAIDLELNYLTREALARLARGINHAPATDTSPGAGDPFAQELTASIKTEHLYLSSRKRNFTRKALACVFRLDRFISGEWFNMTALGGYGELDGPEQILELIVAAGGISRILRPGVTLKGRLPVVWLAFDDELSNVVAGAPTSPANEIRDSLGLLHYQEDHFLCKIVFPPIQVKAIRKRRPTAFDSGANLIFRANEKPDTYGRTVHLKTQAAALREIVSGPVQLDPSDEIVALGRVTESAGFSWKTLANTTAPSRVALASAMVQAATP